MRTLARLLLPALLAVALLTLPALSTRTLGASDHISYVALGDSVPSGTDLADANGYPLRLGMLLADASGQSVRLDNRARAGERSEGVLANQLADLAAGGPNLITL